MVDSQVLERLQEIYQRNSVARAFFRLPAVRASHRTETPIKWALSLLQQHLTASRSDVVRLFKALDKAGAGEFKVGRKGGVSRFVWNYPPAELIRAAFPSLGSAGTTEVASVSPSADAGRGTRNYGVGALRQPEPSSETRQTDQTLLVPHTFQLRPDLVVLLELPIDLTQTEAQRLCSFMASLPFRPEST